LQTLGIAEGREFSPYLDLGYYLSNNQDVANAVKADRTSAMETR
jgi:hypothetical protein